MTIVYFLKKILSINQASIKDALMTKWKRTIAISKKIVIKKWTVAIKTEKRKEGNKKYLKTLQINENKIKFFQALIFFFFLISI